MPIDPRAEPPGYVNGSGHRGGGGGPPASLDRRVAVVEARQEALEDKFDMMINDVRAVASQTIDVQAMAIRLDVEGKRRDIEARDVKKAIESIAKKLDQAAETTGNFRLETVQKELARKEAAEVRRSGALLTLGIGLTLAAITGVAAIIWQLVVNH